MYYLQMFLAWLLYAYTALALRENVLKLNGSYIRYHHLLSYLSK
jgi:hypothetical protein